MLVFEFKIKAKEKQYTAIDEAIRTTQFIRNKCIRYWIDNEKVTGAVLAIEFSFVKELGSQARQASAKSLCLLELMYAHVELL